MCPEVRPCPRLDEVGESREGSGEAVGTQVATQSYILGNMESGWKSEVVREHMSSPSQPWVSQILGLVVNNVS